MALRFLVLSSILFVFSGSCFAQMPTDSTIQRRKWFVPDGILMQYAGGSGLISGGVFYHAYPKTEFAFTVGYTPPKFGNITTLNLYGSYTFRKYHYHNFVFEFVSAGAFVQTSMGDRIYLKWPDRYPEKYYWWNSSIRFGPFLNSQLSYSPQKHKLVYTAFFQCNTNDLYIATYYHSSKAIRFSEILVLGTGLKISFKEKLRPEKPYFPAF